MQPIPYTIAEQHAGWSAPDAGTLAWLQELGSARDQLGSTQAKAWLMALGDSLPEEIIVLPGAPETRALVENNVRTVKYPMPTMLEAYPNPANGPVYVVYHLPEGSEAATLHVVDMTGRTICTRAIMPPVGILELRTDGWAAGLYSADLVIDGRSASVMKLAIAR